MSDLKVVEIREDNRVLVSEFLDTIQNSKKKFRYFDNRELECLENHLVTLVFKLGNRAVAYGHLDEDGGKVWLGVCVSDQYHGIGLGKRMIGCLLEHAENIDLKEINFSVDKNNKVAYSLYEKMGFILEKENGKSFFMKKRSFKWQTL